MSNIQTQKQESKFKSMFASLAIPVLVAVGICIYLFIFGNSVNFENGDSSKGHPLNVMGIIYRGGFIVPILISLILMSITFSIERFMTISKASGKGAAEAFVRKVQSQLTGGNVDAAIAECDKQQGSVANVVKSALVKYKEMEGKKELDVDHKVLSIQKEIEESVSLELPMLEKNLVIIATMASVSTLIALLGTVLGMIRAFAALANAGSPDSVALATGISEALINTALGISNSAVAIIMYNVFTTKIDKITYTIDEAGFSITQQFASAHKS